MASDVVVVGSGPNGLSAAIVLARAGHNVTVRERAARIGGSVSSDALTLPGFVHDVCASVFPLASGSPFFRALPLTSFGLSWAHPAAALAHPFDDGRAAVVRRSVEETARELGADAAAYRWLFEPLVSRWDALARDTLGPILRRPASPGLLARFGAAAALPATTLARGLFQTREARGLFAGIAAHAARPIDRAFTSTFALILGAAAHAAGWPFARGGAGRLAESLGEAARAAGVAIETNAAVTSLAPSPPVRVLVCDVTPHQLAQMGGAVLASGYRRALLRFRRGPGVFKLDWALAGPVPWTAAGCRSAGTVHLGGTLEEIAESERLVAGGRHPDRPFVLLAQPSICDATRAPGGQHAVWAYCHVPNGSTVDMTTAIEHQIERFAPGFRDLILARHAMSPAALETHNPNLLGGDVTGGAVTLRQMVARPTWRQYRTPLPWLYLCSSSTPPGGGVHGMCGYHAARAVIADLNRLVPTRDSASH
jgi:phytoene dehydrogenase-like protein